MIVGGFGALFRGGTWKRPMSELYPGGVIHYTTIVPLTLHLHPDHTVSKPVDQLFFGVLSQQRQEIPLDVAYASRLVRRNIR